MDAAFGGFERGRIRLSALAAEAALSLMGYTSLRPLPPPRLAIPHNMAHPDDLWRQIDTIPREQRDESAFASTIRMTKHDVWRKLADQVAGMAGIGPTPRHLQVIQVSMPSGRAPLHGLFNPPEAARPWVIVVHGLYDSKLSRYAVLLAQALIRQGFGVLLPDMRWHGCLLSRDWLPTLGIEEALDLLEWGRWLKRSHPGHPIGLLGCSIGGLDVIHALSQVEAGEVLQAGGIAISPPASLRGTLDTLDGVASFWTLGMDAVLRKFFQQALGTRMRALGIGRNGAGCFARFLDWLVSRLTRGPEFTTARFLDLADPGSRLPACQRPLLMLVSRNDPIYREPTAAHLVAQAKGNALVRVIETPGGGHIGQPGIYPQWMAEILNQFFSLAAGVSGPPITR
jgi:predicted alpha/beta-fold hydrolase